MRILHTADWHLKDKEHLSIVQSILQLASQEQVDLIIVAGDLFDASANGRMLEAALLPIWSQYSGTILVVPGNHDYKFLQHREELAENVVIANKIPFSVAEIDGIKFVCVPYQNNCSLSDINIPVFDPAILITHGTYGARDNSKKTYFPITDTDMIGRYRYVALGHYHTWFDKWIDGALMVNPGAPRQTRISDKGARYVSLIDTDTWKMERLTLPISFVENKNITLSLIDSEEEIREKLFRITSALLEHPYAVVNLTVKGSLAFSQYSLSERVKIWSQYLEDRGVHAQKITWNLDSITQISPEIIHSAFTRIMIDNISDEKPEELDRLAPFLFERLQFQTQHRID